MKKTLLLMSTLMFILIGCGTIAGAGRDLERGEKAIERAAERASR